jgi:hypothetical protein
MKFGCCRATILGVLFCAASSLAADASDAGAPDGATYFELLSEALNRPADKLLAEFREGLPKSGGARPAYETQRWPSTRTLVWARPGESFKGLAADAANWLENGRAATKGPDKDTDLIFPDSDAEYRVSSKEGVAPYRHLYVGRNARFSTRSGAEAIYGNVWVREGGWLQAAWRTVHMSGGRHAFYRDFNKKLPGFEQKMDRGDRSMHDLKVSKDGGASVEFLGRIAVADEIMVYRGTLIIGPGCEMRCNIMGPTAMFAINPEATLELQSGAVFGKHRSNVGYKPDLMVRGTVRGGSEARPLTSDAYLLLSTHTRGKNGLDDRPRVAAMVVEGALRSHSADPDKARLVISSIETPDRPGGPVGGNPFRYGGWGGPKGPVRQQRPDPQIKIDIPGESALNGVLFDYFTEAGIRMKDLDARKRWKGVHFGPHNLAPPEMLFAEIKPN